MNNFLKTLSRGTIAFLSIGIAILVIVYMDPPHTLCNSEKEQLLSVQKNFLNPNPELKKAFKKAKSPYDRLYTSCKESENSGGCLEYFLSLKKFVSDFEVSSKECRPRLFTDKKIKTVFTNGLELMLNLAWGKAPPSEFKKKYAWFDQADLYLFCKVKKLTKNNLSKNNWEKLRESLLLKLPGTENLSREQLWKSSLLSISCKNYL